MRAARAKIELPPIASTQPAVSSKRKRAGRYTVRSVVNERANNEDSFLVCSLTPAPGAPPLTLLAIADGMGGHAHGEDASREALRKLALVLCDGLMIEPRLNLLAEPAPWRAADKLGDLLIDAIEQANAYVLRLSTRNGWRGAGTTLVAALICEHTAVALNLGDSPLFQARRDGLARVTDDHSVAGALVRTGELTAAQARQHPGRHQLEFHLGTAVLPARWPVRQINLVADDLLLLCSDGVSGRLPEERIATILKRARCSRSSGFARAADLLLAAAREEGETDNQTLILWQC